MTGSTAPYRVPWTTRVRARIRRFVPILVWAAVAALTVGLYLRRVQHSDLVGLVREFRYEVAATTTGRIDRLEVDVLEPVKRGQVIASLDRGRVLLQLDLARKELARLDASLKTELSELVREKADDRARFERECRRYARDLEQARVDHLRARVEYEEGRVRLQGLQLRLDRSERMSSQEVTSVARLDQDRMAHDALKQRLAQQRELLAGLVKVCDGTRKRYEKFVEAGPANAETTDVTSPLRFALDVQKVRIEEVNLAIGRLVLRAPADGKVTGILRRAGEFVARGEPVVEIVRDSASEVVVYVPEARIGEVQPGFEVRLQRTSDARTTIESAIRAVGARIERLPQRLTVSESSPQWGLPVYVPLPAGCSALPGESFRVAISPGR